MAIIANGAEDLTLAFDGFVFEEAKIDAPITSVLMMPLQGIASGEETVYQNMIGIMTSALLFREEWNSTSLRSKGRYISAIARHWGIGTKETLSSIVDMEADRLEAWEHLLNQNRPHLDDTPVVAKSIRDLHRLVKMPVVVPTTPNLIPPRPVSVICTSLVDLIRQGDDASHALLQDKDHPRKLSNIIERFLNPTGQLLVEQMIEESQRPGQTSRSIVRTRDDLLQEFCDTIYGIYRMEQSALHNINELGVWKPRLMGFTNYSQEDQEAEQAKASLANDQVQLDLAVEEIKPAPVSQGDNAKIDNGVISIMRVKRKRDGSDGPNPKRRCVHADSADDAANPPLSRQCVLM
ncbi:hypothetical protein ABKA04_008196 [Annulohypoxylon sp. FPYF3050]